MARAQAAQSSPQLWPAAVQALPPTLRMRRGSESHPATLQKEASEVFFSVTKLYQSKDANLRRMVYLVIKDVCPGSDEVIIITSSLMKDMNSKTDLYRSNAIRVLCSITDSQLLGQIERYLKQVTSCMSYAAATALAALNVYGVAGVLINLAGVYLERRPCDVPVHPEARHQLPVMHLWHSAKDAIPDVRVLESSSRVTVARSSPSGPPQKPPIERMQRCNAAEQVCKLVRRQP